MREVLCVVLGGGRGTRLFPLTKERAKPAVPFAGRYRLVDIPISNSLNSGFNHIYVLTQFNSESLNKHITRAYNLDSFSQGFVEIMAAEQSTDSTDWFQGTADAVRRCMKHFNDPHIRYVLILSGDQLYKMDFRRMLEFHIEKKSEITIACHPVEAAQIKEYGIMCVDKQYRIKEFVEKPQGEDHAHGMSVMIGHHKRYLASMGIYIFNKDILTEILTNNKKADFGRGVIPDSFPGKMTYAYVHQGYWEDIGTIRAFHHENLVFTEPVPPINLFDEDWPFFTRARYMPPAKLEQCTLDRVIVSEGSIIGKADIRHSVVGLRSRISDDVIVEDSILMGADYYQSLDDMEEDRRLGIPYIGIGRGSVIKQAIIDKNTRIGENVQILNREARQSFDSNLYYIRDGIVVIPKDTIIPPGMVI